MGNSDEKSHLCIVGRVFPMGPHGPYVLATSKTLEGTVTFSLSESGVWQEDRWPEPGHKVLVGDITQKGVEGEEGPAWRAYKARFVRPSDHQRGKRRQ